MTGRNQLVVAAVAALAGLVLVVTGVAVGTATALVFGALYALHLRIANA